jgi:membrane protease YdiL (CAAX protease family)
VAIHAFIASGLGVLATNPLETEPTRRVEQKYIYLYLAVSALYAPAIYLPSSWSRLGQVLLSSILAFAVWQKAREHLPFLLDPADAPPRRLSLLHGILTALGYFGLQALAMALFLPWRVHPGVALLLSALGAGLAAATVSLCVLGRIPDFLEVVGLKPRPGTVSKSCLLGIAGGIAAAAGGFLYLRLAGAWEPLRILQDEALALRDQARALDPSTLVAVSFLAVLVAPACEEYIFRGLIFQGLRRSMGALPAILLSAAVFSVFHPPLAALPVFVLGVIAAWARERTGYLLAPILIHAIYNLAMVVAEGL